MSFSMALSTLADFPAGTQTPLLEIISENASPSAEGAKTEKGKITMASSTKVSNF